MGVAILSMFEWCPSWHSFCWCVSLRLGVLYGACIGLVWGALHLAAYSSAGVAALETIGLPEHICAKRGVKLVNYVLGVLLCAGHGLLLDAVIARSSTLCMLYAGLATALAVILLALGPAAALAAVSQGAISLNVASLVSLLAIFAALGLLYLASIVVNYCSTIPPKH